MKQLAIKSIGCALGMALACCSGASLSATAFETKPVAAPATNKLAMPVKNLASAFITFWDATQGQPTEARVAAFKRDIAPQFAEFYGIARDNGRITEQQQDAKIARAIEQFGPQRTAFVDKVAAFELLLDRNVRSFRQVFPDFHGDVPLYLLHSLGEMDGGTRTLSGKNHLIFGVDGMVRYHKPGSDESAFFHHELFHVYHTTQKTDCEEMWCSLWREGLAVHVAKTLNPNASEDELLLAIPAGLVTNTQTKRRESLADLKSVLDSTDHEVYAGLFSTQGKANASGLPTRRGYVLGYWVAQELGKRYNLRELAKMPPDQVKPLVFAAVDALLAQASR